MQLPDPAPINSKDLFIIFFPTKIRSVKTGDTGESTAFKDKQSGIRMVDQLSKTAFFFLNGELARKTAPTIIMPVKPRMLTADEAKNLADYAKRNIIMMSVL